MKGSFDSDSTSNNLYIMAWIYRAQNGDLMFSKTKPEKVYRFKFRNDQFHSDVYCKQLSPEHIISISVYESQFESSEDGYGASGIARIFSTILSMGMSNLACTKYSKCVSCGDIKEL